MTAEATLLEADRKARVDALDVSRSYIVQAPAGSGKTELLIQRYLCLLGSVSQPEEVVAITFTRKAAFEMQLRVINALRAARDGATAATAHEELTLAKAAAVLARDRELGWGLLETPARLRIQTVDGFCAGVARSAPLCSGIGGLTVTAADADIPGLYREAAAATLDYLVDDGDPAAAVQRVLTHLDGNVALYIDYLGRMLASREQWLAITGSGVKFGDAATGARRRLENNIADVIARRLAALDALVPAVCRDQAPGLLQYAARNRLAAGAPDDPLSVCADLDAFPEPDLESRRQWGAYAHLLLTGTGQWRKRITVNEGFPPRDEGQKKRLADIIEAMAGCHGFREGLHGIRMLPEPHYSEAQWRVLLALFQLLPLAVAELRRLFGERGVSDHTEVALAAANALGGAEEPGELSMMLDYRIRHLLVDEMQDTSINQYDLLRRLTAGWSPDDGRTVFCVGDPMQSIYRFRDAEVGEFLLARDNGIGGVGLENLILRRNFRSGGNLVHWFNRVFAQVMPLRDDVAAGAISYTESVAVPDKAGRGESCIHPLLGADPATEARYTTGIVRHCLDTPAEETVAVLVRGRTQLRELLPLLRREELEFQAVDIDRLTDLPEVIELLALTRALCHEGDRLAWLGLLRGPLVGLGWGDLHALVGDDAQSAVPSLALDAERLASISAEGRELVSGFMRSIAPYRGRRGDMLLRERVEGAWCAAGGPAALRDAAELDNACRFLDAVGRLEACGTLDDVAEIEARLDAERVSSRAGAGCRLQVMTMHKAKGLQFDHVILHGLGRTSRDDQREVLNWLTVPDSEGRSEMIISPVGPRSARDNDPLHRYIETVEREKSRMEMDRLLYVACTRARQSLHIVGSVSADAAGAEPRQPDARSLLSRLWPAVESDYLAAFDALVANGETGERSEEERETLATPTLHRLRPGWMPASIPAPPHVAEPRNSPADDREVEFSWVGSTARYAGTMVHRWLQLLADGGWGSQARDREARMQISRRWASELGVGPKSIGEVCERTEAAVTAVLTDDRGRWILESKGRSEMPITGLVDGRVESVVLDRVLIDASGEHWVIDYKTSTHEGGDLEGFLAQEEIRYRPQLEKYGLLYERISGSKPRLALYFPLLRRFRELAPAGNRDAGPAPNGTPPGPRS